MPAINMHCCQQLMLLSVCMTCVAMELKPAVVPVPAQSSLGDLLNLKLSDVLNLQQQQQQEQQQQLPASITVPGSDSPVEKQSVTKALPPAPIQPGANLDPIKSALDTYLTDLQKAITTGVSHPVLPADLEPLRESVEGLRNAFVATKVNEPYPNPKPVTVSGMPKIDAMELKALFDDFKAGLMNAVGGNVNSTIGDLDFLKDLQFPARPSPAPHMDPNAGLKDLMAAIGPFLGPLLDALKGIAESRGGGGLSGAHLDGMKDMFSSMSAAAMDIVDAIKERKDYIRKYPENGPYQNHPDAPGGPYTGQQQGYGSYAPGFQGYAAPAYGGYTYQNPVHQRATSHRMVESATDLLQLLAR